MGALLGALTVATFGNRINRRVLIFGGLGTFSAMLLLLALAQNYYLSLGFLAVGGWGMLLFLATANTLIQTSVPDNMRGRVMGIWALVFGGMMPVGGISAGTLSHYLGVQWTIGAGALVCALAAFGAWRLVQRNQEMKNAK